MWRKTERLARDERLDVEGLSKLYGRVSVEHDEETATKLGVLLYAYALWKQTSRGRR